MSTEPVESCGTCYPCEGGQPQDCYGCLVHGAWCDWFGEGPKCKLSSTKGPSV